MALEYPSPKPSNMKQFYLAVLFQAVLSGLLAQQPSEVLPCATNTFNVLLSDSYPSYLKSESKLESLYRVSTRANSLGSNKSLYTLPVAVHIIHNNGQENISDAQVLRGIAFLNEAFANQGYFNPATGVDTEIQFCLAQRDPDGNASNGIIRYQSPFTDMSVPYGHSDLFSLADWDSKNYINIVLVKEACLFGNCHAAGYATLPPAHGLPGDGIVMEARFFGTDERDAVVITHEMGHYLGLRHTFDGGCPNGDCLSDGDRICDTPPDSSNGGVPCDGDVNSCDTDPDDPSPTNPFRDTSLGGWVIRAICTATTWIIPLTSAMTGLPWDRREGCTFL